MYIDQLYKSVDAAGKEFYYAAYKILGQLIPMKVHDKGIEDNLREKNRLIESTVAVYDSEKKKFSGTAKSTAVVKVLGDEGCSFWDWGYKDTYPSKNSPSEITSDFTGTAYGDVVKNLIKSCYDTDLKSQIYAIILPVTDRKDKHNTWKNSYSARVDLESIDAAYLRKLNGGELFDPTHLISDDHMEKGKAMEVMRQAIAKLNSVCNDSLKSNVLQGARLAKESGDYSESSSNPFKSGSNTLIEFNSYIIKGDEEEDEGNVSDAAAGSPLPKKKRKNKVKEKKVVIDDDE